MSSKEAGIISWRDFLMQGTRTAKLATVRLDGRPHVAPVAFVLHEDELLFTTAATSVKGKTLLRSGLASAAVDDEFEPYPFVIVEGTISVSEDLDEMLTWSTKIGARYVGEARAVAFGERNAVPGSLLVRLAPKRVIERLNGKPRRTIEFGGTR